MKSGVAKGILPLETDVTLGAKEPCVLSVELEDGVSWSIGKMRSYSVRTNSFKSDLERMSVLSDC